MRTPTSILLTLLLSVGVNPASAAEPGPIAASVRRLSSASLQSVGSRASDWASVLRIAPGSEIQLTRDGSPPARRHLVVADRDSLLVLNLAHPALTSSIRDALLDVARVRPDALAAVRQGVPFEHHGVRIAPEGIVVANRIVADLDAVLETIRPSAVVEIRGAPERHGSKLGATAAGLGGFLLGLSATGHLAFKQCGSTCKDEGALIFASLVGLPIGAGLLGWHGFARTTRPLIYRRN